ncbi:hypothetical protein P0D88_46295 [Paraburkholderia sp. RL18-103-BIB-C]|uniref:hypothetical protein n=1 Tax=unclassified Paraburkholderia TaxID=2615204 RepID=UPI0038BCD05D
MSASDFRPAFSDEAVQIALAYSLVCTAMAFRTGALIASGRKLAPLYIGGNSMAVWVSFAISRRTNGMRQNSYTKQLKYANHPLSSPVQLPG